MAEHLTFNQRVRGSNPRCLTTPEQSPLCSGLFFCLWLQNKPSAHFPTPLSAKGHARPTCSVASTLAAALVAANLLQVHVYFKTFCRRLYKTERVLPVPFFLLLALTSKDNGGSARLFRLAYGSGTARFHGAVPRRQKISLSFKPYGRAAAPF